MVATDAPRMVLSRSWLDAALTAGPDLAGIGCPAMARCPTRAAPRPGPHRARVAVYGAVYMCRVHRRTPTPSDAHADHMSATTATPHGRPP